MNLVKITDFMSEDLVDLNLKAKNKEEIIASLATLLSKSGMITDEDACKTALLDREELGSTGIGKGVAIPHAKTEAAKDLTIAFGLCRDGVDFNAVDEEPVEIFFVFASPEKNSQKYLKILARISRLIRNENFRKNLIKSETAKDVINLINNEEKN